MDNVQELDAELTAEPRPDESVAIQFGGFLLKLSLDWIVLRASENMHQLLGQSHVTLIDEPLGRFVHSQALHDLRNLFSRLSGTTGIARAYGVRLTDDRDLFDIAFQLSEGRVILEAVPSPGEGFGQAFGTVGGLIAGLNESRGQTLLDAGARRMRALTGYDRVTLLCGDRRAESSRGDFHAPADLAEALPALIADTEASAVPVFPRSANDRSIEAALMGIPSERALASLRDAGIRSTMCVKFDDGEFRCDCRRPSAPNLEIHAAAELFVQLFAMRLEIDRLRDR
jgi:hypothetical protein